MKVTVFVIGKGKTEVELPALATVAQLQAKLKEAGTLDQTGVFKRVVGTEATPLQPTDVLSDADRLTFNAGTVETNKETGEVSMKTKNIGGALTIGLEAAPSDITQEEMFKLTIIEQVVVHETIIPNFMKLGEVLTDLNIPWTYKINGEEFGYGQVINADTVVTLERPAKKEEAAPACAPCTPADDDSDEVDEDW